MAVVALEVKTRQALAGGQDFGDVGRCAQIDGTAHIAVDPAHLLNRCFTDIDLAPQHGDGLVRFSADIRILTPEDSRRGNHRLLFDVPNRGNRLALATFNRVPRPINPSAPTDPGNGFLMRHGYTVGIVPCRLRGPFHASLPKTKFAADSALEGAGFEPSVPRDSDDGFRSNSPA
jgi:hypothetical protein